MRFLFTALTFSLLMACDQKIDIPKGFEVMHSKGSYHFVYAYGNVVGSSRKQRDGGKAICKKYSPEQDCQVFFWKVREKVALGFPIIRSGAVKMGYYQNVGQKIKQKVLR